MLIVRGDIDGGRGFIYIIYMNCELVYSLLTAKSSFSSFDTRIEAENPRLALIEQIDLEAQWGQFFAYAAGAGEL